MTLNVNQQHGKAPPRAWISQDADQHSTTATVVTQPFHLCISYASFLQQARGSHLRVHFKNTRETAFALRKMELGKAKRYLEDVLAHKRCVPFHR